MTDDHEIDSAMDEVARQMTAGAPSPRFRARLLARVEARRVEPGRWTLPAIALAAPVIVVALFVLVNRTADRGSREPGAAAPMAAAPRRTTPSSPPPVASPPSPRRVRPVRPPMHLPIEASELDALAPPALAVTSIAVAGIPSPPSISVEPLADVQPLAVVALDQSEGDRR